MFYYIKIKLVRLAAWIICKRELEFRKKFRKPNDKPGYFHTEIGGKFYRLEYYFQEVKELKEKEKQNA